MVPAPQPEPELYQILKECGVIESCAAMSGIRTRSSARRYAFETAVCRSAAERSTSGSQIRFTSLALACAPEWGRFWCLAERTAGIDSIDRRSTLHRGNVAVRYARWFGRSADPDEVAGPRESPDRGASRRLALRAIPATSARRHGPRRRGRSAAIRGVPTAHRRDSPPRTRRRRALPPGHSTSKLRPNGNHFPRVPLIYLPTSPNSPQTARTLRRS